MNITILNGNPKEEDSGFDAYLARMKTGLESQAHKVTIVKLRDMDIRYCIGCFGCWVKTPGECANAADDTQVVRHAYVNSDLVIFASPVIMGFTSALLKKAHDKLIPLLMPYTRLYEGETHHTARYDKYPLIALLLQPDESTDAEDIDIISEIYRRDAINFKTSLLFTHTTESPVEEVVDAVAGT